MDLSVVMTTEIQEERYRRSEDTRPRRCFKVGPTGSLSNKANRAPSSSEAGSCGPVGPFQMAHKLTQRIHERRDFVCKHMMPRIRKLSTR